MSGIIVIAADIVPTQSNTELFENGETLRLIGKNLIDLLHNADFIAMNLETPLCDELSPITKCGPCLNAPTNTIKGIKNINPYFFTLANNHIMDQGIQGLESTISILNKSGIHYSGVGKNLEEALKPYIVSVNDKKIGFYCCAEHEFSIATEEKPGANPYDPLYSFDHVKELKKQCDYAVVLYHGGKEHYRYPSPNLQKIFRKFAECGADLVIAQHTHCIGCMEEYNGSTLVYGQGNFLFDQSESEYWKTSLIICVDVSKNSFELSFIPIVKEENCVRMAIDKECEVILEAFYNRSEEIQKKDFVKERYIEFAREMEKEYLLRLYGKKSKSMLVRILNKLSDYRYIKFQYPVKNKVVVRNVIECEAHNELATTVMNLSVDGDK